MPHLLCHIGLHPVAQEDAVDQRTATRRMIEQHDRRAVQVFPAHAAALGEWMVATANEAERVGQQRLRPQAFGIERLHHHTEIRPTRADQLQRVDLHGVTHDHADVRVARRTFRHVQRHQTRRHRRAGRHHHAPAPLLAHLARLMQRVIQIGNQTIERGCQ